MSTSIVTPTTMTYAASAPTYSAAPVTYGAPTTYGSIHPGLSAAPVTMVHPHSYATGYAAHAAPITMMHPAATMVHPATIVHPSTTLSAPIATEAVDSDAAENKAMAPVTVTAAPVTMHHPMLPTQSVGLTVPHPANLAMPLGALLGSTYTVGKVHKPVLFTQESFLAYQTTGELPPPADEPDESVSADPKPAVVEPTSTNAVVDAAPAAVDGASSEKKDKAKKTKKAKKSTKKAKGCC